MTRENDVLSDAQDVPKYLSGVGFFMMKIDQHDDKSIDIVVVSLNVVKCCPMG